MQTEWIAVDWGTSHVRAWVMGPDDRVLDRRESSDGMGRLSPAEFEPALLRLIGDALPDGRLTPVICCGMVGARQGWAEAAYAKVPCKPPLMRDAFQVQASDPRLLVHILPGLSQARPADVMRGEETQIAGFQALNPHFDGVICLPGTHSKWVQVSAGEVVSFQSFMTGEMFALLSQQSVLRHSMGDGWDDAAFAEAVGDAMSRPAAIGAKLFAIRAEGLVAGLDAGTAKARLSGYLIGLEMAGAKPYWLGQNVAIIGADALAVLYRKTLEAQGVPVIQTDAERMTLEGLKAARNNIEGGAA